MIIHSIIAISGAQANGKGICTPCSSSKSTSVVTMAVIIAVICAGLFVMYYIILYTDRSLMRVVKAADKARVAELQASAKLNGSHRYNRYNR